MLPVIYFGNIKKSLKFDSTRKGNSDIQLPTGIGDLLILSIKLQDTLFLPGMHLYYKWWDSV